MHQNVYLSVEPYLAQFDDEETIIDGQVRDGSFPCSEAIGRNFASKPVTDFRSKVEFI